MPFEPAQKSVTPVAARREPGPQQARPSRPRAIQSNLSFLPFPDPLDRGHFAQEVIARYKAIIPLARISSGVEERLSILDDRTCHPVGNGPATFRPEECDVAYFHLVCRPHEDDVAVADGRVHTDAMSLEAEFCILLKNGTAQLEEILRSARDFGQIVHLEVNLVSFA